MHISPTLESRRKRNICWFRLPAITAMFSRALGVLQGVQLKDKPEVLRVTCGLLWSPLWIFLVTYYFIDSYRAEQANIIAKTLFCIKCSIIKIPSTLHSRDPQGGPFRFGICVVGFSDLDPL